MFKALVFFIIVGALAFVGLYSYLAYKAITLANHYVFGDLKRENADKEL